MVHWTDRDTGVLTSSSNVAVAWSRLPAFSWRTIIVHAHALHVRWRHPDDQAMASFPDWSIAPK